MHYPLVGERVWVSGCLHEFIVAEADYATCIAKIFRSGVDAATRRCLPFSLLFAHEDFSDAQDGVTSGPAVREVLRASRLRVHQSQLYLTELRETIRITMQAIQKSQALIEESDQVIARSRTLDGCRPPLGERRAKPIGGH